MHRQGIETAAHTYWRRRTVAINIHITDLRQWQSEPERFFTWWFMPTTQTLP